MLRFYVVYSSRLNIERLNPKPQPRMPSAATRTSASAPARPFTVQRARFGRAPRVVIPAQLGKPARPARTSASKAFDKKFSRMAHRLRFREVGKALAQFGDDVHERVCSSYATYSVGGVQFAVVKPLSDGGLRIGVAVEDAARLEEPCGLGSSERINGQFELKSYEPLRRRGLGLLRAAYNEAVAE